MDSRSIKNLKLKYYVITYFWNNKDNVYFIISINEMTALVYFFTQSLLSGIVLSKKDILDIKELEIMNPN